MYKEYFVENQTPKASEPFLDAVEGCNNVVKILVWKKCLKLTPELEEMIKSISKSNILSKANSDRAQALICHYFPTHYSIALPTRASETWREWKSANGSKKVMSQETSPPTTPTVCLKPTSLPTLRITPHIAEHSCDWGNQRGVSASLAPCCHLEEAAIANSLVLIKIKYHQHHPKEGKNPESSLMNTSLILFTPSSS